MGGKKTVEDSRRFEKDRRDKLNAAFEELCKLLPDHDPSVTLSKIEILRKAAQYIRNLQDQNDEIMKLGSDSVLRTESEKLRKRVTHLLLKTKELVDALRVAGIPIPTNKKGKKKKVAQINSANQNHIAPEKQVNAHTSKNDGQILRKVKCGCMQITPEKKPLKESNPIATSQSSSVGNVTSVGTSGQSLLNGTNILAVTPPLISAPIMATRIQNVPIAPNSALPSSFTPNPSIISSHVVSSVNSLVIEGDKLLGNAVTINSNSTSLVTSKLSGQSKVMLPPNLVKEIMPSNIKKGTIVVTTTSSNVITTQSIVTSSHLINLPQNNVITNPIVAPRIQNVPVIEKNILSNLGPGTLILADGRIMNVPPIVPQIVVKPQPAVILMPTAKKKEKLIIPKRREVTKTTFANKAPIPAIQTFRLESCPRVRPKKKPKTTKKVEKVKNNENTEAEQSNKKRKLGEVALNESSEVMLLPEGNSPKVLVIEPASSKENSRDTSESNQKHSGCNSVSLDSSSSVTTDETVSIPVLTANESYISEISTPPLKSSANLLSAVSVMESTISSVMATNITSSIATIQPASSFEKGSSMDIQSMTEENQVCSENNIQECSSFFTQTEAPNSIPVLTSSSSSSLINSDRNVQGAPISVSSESLNIELSQETLPNHFDVSTENSSVKILNNSETQKDEPLVHINSISSANISNNNINNIPPCISSSTEQGSIFVSVNNQGLLPENRSTLSEDPVVNKICSDVENSVTETTKNHVETRSYRQENVDLSSLSQPNTSPVLKDYATNEFNATNQTLDNRKPPKENVVVTKNSSQIIVTSSEFVPSSISSSSGIKINSNIATPDISSQVPLNSRSTAINDVSRPLKDQEANYSQSRSDFNQTSSCTNSISTESSIANCGLTVSISQNASILTQGKSFTRMVNTLPQDDLPRSLSSLDYTNISNVNVVSQSQNTLPTVCTANSQDPATNHSSYGIPGVLPEKESLFFNSVFSKPTTLNSNEKPINNYNKNINSAESLTSNVFSVYSSSAANSSGKTSNSQNTFHSKSTDISGNALPITCGRNADIYNNFNQTVPTETVDRTFYPQNVSFPHNGLSKSSHWDKSQFNKSLDNSGFVETSEELNPKICNTFYQNKNVSYKKQNEHSQISYFGFQNEPVVTSQSNRFFHNLPCSTMLPSSCGFSDTPAVFSYHNSSASGASYSFISHENISSLNRGGSVGGLKNSNQERGYPPDTVNAEKNKGNSLRSNEKSNVGNISFYPSTSQTFMPGVYPSSTQPNLSTVYSTLAQPNLSSVYSNSSQISTSIAYSNSSLHNISTYSNSISHNVAGVYSSSSYPIVSSVYSNFSQPSASGVYTTSAIASVFTRSTQQATSNAYSGSTQLNASNVKNSSSVAYLNSNLHSTSSSCSNLTQSNVSSAYICATQSSASSAYGNTPQVVYSSSALPTSSCISTSQNSASSYSNKVQTNVSGIVTSIVGSNISNVYTSTSLPNIQCVYTCASLPSIANVFSSSMQSKAVNRYSTCDGISGDTILYQTETVSKPSESNARISFNNYMNASTNSLNRNDENDQSPNASGKNSKLIVPDNSTALNDLNKNKENTHNCPASLPDSNLNDRRQSKSIQTYLLDKDVSKNKYATPDKVASIDLRPSDTEKNQSIPNANGKDHPSPQISVTSSKNAERVDKDRSSEKFNSYDFSSNSGKDIQNKRIESNVSIAKNSEIIDNSMRNNFISEKKSLGTEGTKIPTTSSQNSNEVRHNESNYNYNNQASNNYQKVLQTPNTSFSSNHSKHTISTIHAKSYTNFNSSVCETLSNQYNNESLSKGRSIGVCTAQRMPQSSQSESIGVTGPSAEHISKTGMVDATHRLPEKQDKSMQKSYEAANINNNLKADIPSDFLKSKDIERNTFIPIIDDVRLSTDFSSDLFNSLQVPTGGAHSESISPTAAFLLAFPLVSTSRNVESLQDNENQENQTSTPTTILQIGNIEPPSTELFHPIDFQKTNPKATDHFDINNDYLHTSDLQDKQNHTVYRRCEKRKENFAEFNKETRPSDPKQKSKSTVVTTSTYTQSYTQPLLSCNEYQYCDKDSSQWQQEFSANITKETKKACDRKKEKVAQKGCFHQAYGECYNYKEKKRKQQNRISVNWMTTPETREQADYQNKEPELVNNLIGPPAQSLYGGISLDFPTETFPDFCNTKKTNNYSWSPNKTLLPTLDNHLMIPSTLPTLVGDLALGTSTPSESYKAYETPKSQVPVQMSKKTNEKLDASKKQSEFSKNQGTFFSVSQLVDPKSKKPKTSERNYKRPDKNTKPRSNFNCPKRKEDNCMYYEERNSFIPSQNQYNEKRNPYKGSYSAESLIGVQHNEIDFSSNFNYQQNPNYFQSEFPPTMESTSQQYGYFQQTHFTGFSHDECQEFGFNTSQRGLDSNRQKGPARKEENYNGTSLLQPQICPPYSKTMNYNLPTSHLNTNTTTTLTNFNLSTIFPEMNDQQVGTSVQPSQQMNNSYPNSQNYRSHLS